MRGPPQSPILDFLVISYILLMISYYFEDPWWFVMVFLNDFWWLLMIIRWKYNWWFFALTSPFDDLDSELALELAELAAELAACFRGGVVASADCDLRGFWDFGVANFGALKRAISFFSSVFFACTPCKVSLVISFSRTFLSNSFWSSTFWSATFS